MPFVRVKDKSTGHQFDVPESDTRIGKSVELVDQKHWPPSRYARRPKHNVAKAPSTPTTTGRTTPSNNAQEDNK